MATRANWNLSSLDLGDEGDPVQDIMAIAKPIDLSKSVPELHADLQRLAAREGRLSDSHGLECDRKWQPDTSCYDCPYYEGHDMTSDKLKPILCRLGREQEDKLAEIDARRELDETVVVIEQAIERDELEELADLALPIAV